MTTPTQLQWRSGSGLGTLPQADIKTRTLWALAAIVSGQNPDGTVRGS